MQGNRETFIIGIDEAGRGPLAGPVVVAGVKIKPGHARRVLFGIRDSKKLSPAQREAWYRVLTHHPAIEWAVARVSPMVIDRINISAAGNLGARRVYSRLSLERDSRLSLESVLVDAGLTLPSSVRYKAIIKGDEKIPAVSAASIIAKVTRDRLMVRTHKKFPLYRFDLHKGYGTVLHRRLLKQHGFSPIHRASFSVR
ncbi:MAG: hypothetical protein A3J10_01890 [Candidatus Sungbacteria bacterium RIFCSPLOWO2_02_FULL_54_10]|uniref:Ribonuclease HII n=2 Tax=Candidatus Sungiibacteriota TaxID=1817917 RepID=A0A1G2L8J3_9BACT|nr:MAG: hypothetical protein A2679_01550 [Candidatus Sungbacteria bacterium RIFCSPHIGHO2_01_FULL_54_26]OHA03285.1 MAG: hypothetical protein A3C92_03390 [Candidatus Sungbacteria bacterium RIFCSPHIGHO2_02_FULL_53_17]OHA07102.1 MAG: hypothetical protein A3B34_02050 [Candidatus Sungbacteria bacterium RIFCSPLOWO2_01_FULL_54_21]OHA12801.1 MAG: hypothetical protein A3J10_01890 [Candidatus Sungbacteria bacterium RIFCSPLOWO2_02_FULL_54_10]